MDVLGVDNVFVEVGDLEQAVRFYEDGLGLPVAKRFDQMGMALLALGDETPGLGIGAVPEPKVGGQKIWLEVGDARTAAEELGLKGIRPLAPPFLIPTGWAFEVQDPWGNVIGFTDYAARPELGRH
jgi:predicted enzyme related to lactoylglutathione lyase